MHDQPFPDYNSIEKLNELSLLEFYKELVIQVDARVGFIEM